MNDIEQLKLLISNILQPDNQQLRANAQNTMNQLKLSKPNQLIFAYLAILQNQSTVDLRSFSATQLRLNLSDFSPSTYTNLWSKLNKQTQNQVKVKLFEILYKEQNLSVKKYIGDALGQIAGSIISTNGQNCQWPEFKKHLWTLFQDSNISQSISAFNVLSTFFSFDIIHFKQNTQDLHILFKSAFSHNNEKLKLAALKCFSIYLQSLDFNKFKVFDDLVIPIYEIVYFFISSNNPNDQSLQILSDMIGISPKFFKKRFKELFELCKKLFVLPNLQSGIKRMITQLLLDFSEKYPPMMRKKKDVLQSIVQMIFTHMIQIQPKITDQWKNPPEGHNDDMQDQADFQTTRFGMSAIDRMVYFIGDEQMLPILSQTIQKILANNDWRYRYTAIMTLSQIGQYIEQIQKIESVMGMITSFLTDQNPMLRYAACHAIGQISDDMQPQFQKVYGDKLLPPLMHLLKDHIPRVVAHAAASMTNLLETMKYAQIQKIIDPLMQLLIFHAQNGISLVKQSALSCISSVAEVACQNFQKYFEKCAILLFNNFQKYHTKQYRQLKGQSIETLTIIAQYLGGQIFQPVAQKLFYLMIKLQASTFQQTDPQKTYILAGWQRICLTYGKQLYKYLDQIIPSLFELVQKVINIELEAANDPKQQQSKGKANTFQTEQAEIAIQMINIFIQQLEEFYSPYVPKTVDLLCKIITDHPNQDVKQQSCKCLPNLIKTVKKTDLNIAINMAKHFLKTLLESVKQQFQTTVIATQLDSLKNILQQIGVAFLSIQQLSEFSQKILKMLESSDKKKQYNDKYMSRDDVDDDEKQLIKDQIRTQELIQVSISELIGVIFKTHKEMTLPLANYIIKQILPKTFNSGNSQRIYKFGIFLIDDMVQFLGYEHLQSNWSHFSEVLVKFSQDSSISVRQAACYGLGIIGKSTPLNVATSQTVKNWLEALIFASKIQKGSQKQKIYNSCKDNAIASIGKIIKAKGSIIDPKPYLAVWMNFLPLKHDKPEAVEQHQFLCDILNNNQQLLIGTQQPSKIVNWQRILSLLADINSHSKITNQAIRQKTIKYINSLKKNEAFIKNIKDIWEVFSEKQKEQLAGLGK